MAQRWPTVRGLGALKFCFGRRLGLPSAYFPCIIEYALSNREAQWRVLKAKTNEMQSSTPRPAYLRSAVLPLPQRQRYQNKPASPRELCLRTSKTKNDLIDVLYRKIKLELADAMMSDYPRKKCSYHHA